MGVSVGEREWGSGGWTNCRIELLASDMMSGTKRERQPVLTDVRRGKGEEDRGDRSGGREGA